MYMRLLAAILSKIKTITTTQESEIQTIESKLPVLASDIEVKATTPSANAWFYTGLSFTIDDGYCAIVRLFSGFSSGMPIGLGLSSATTLPNNAPNMSHYNNGFYIASSSAFLVKKGTYYMYAMRNGGSDSVENTYSATLLKFKV